MWSTVGKLLSGRVLFLLLDKYIVMIFLHNAHLSWSCFPWQAVLLLYVMLYMGLSEELCPGAVELERELGTCPCVISELLEMRTVLRVRICAVPEQEPRATTMAMNSVRE